MRGAKDIFCPFLVAFYRLLDRQSQEKEIQDFYDDVINKTGYMQYLELDKETAEDRKANVMELLANLVRYMEENEDGTLTGFLEEVALMTDIDNYNADNECVVMMTLHSAKGLEFPYVFTFIRFVLNNVLNVIIYAFRFIL